MESLGKRERSDEVTVTNDPITGYLVRPAIGGPQDIFCVPNASIHFPTFVRGDGVHVWDAQGNRYIDLIAGTFNCNIGQANAHVAEAMASQARTLTFTSLRTGRHMPALTLARRVAEVAGPGFERCLFVSGGSEGIDMAIAFLRQYAYAQGHPKKTHLNFLAAILPRRDDANHGRLWRLGFRASIRSDGFLLRKDTCTTDVSSAGRPKSSGCRAGDAGGT